MDRCERTNENGESTFWEGHWLERSIKKSLIPQKAMQEKKGEGTRDMRRNGEDKWRPVAKIFDIVVDQDHKRRDGIALGDHEGTD